MRFIGLLPVLCIVSLLFATEVRAAPDAKAVIARGKRATAMIEQSEGSATAFCIDAKSRIFATNAHAVAAKADPAARDGVEDNGAAPEKAIRVVINPGEQDQHLSTATVLRLDEKIDLALIQLAAEPAIELTALELGDSNSLVETQALTSFGYPFGRFLADKDDYPNITISTGRVTALRKRKGELVAVQLDNSLNPGNSGGPVLDDAGRVVGIVVAGIRGSGVNFAIPASALRQLLAKPVVTFTPQAVAFADAAKARPFVIHVSSLSKEAEPSAVELVLDPGGATQRVLKADRGKDDAYVVTAVPLPPRTSPPQVRLTVRFPDGAVSCLADDSEITVGDRKLKLSQIRRIETLPHEPPKIVLDGEVLRTALPDDATFTGKLGGGTDVKLDLAKASSAEIEVVADGVAGVRYRIVTRRDDKITSETLGEIPITGGPPVSVAVGALPSPSTKNSAPTTTRPTSPNEAVATVTPDLPPVTPGKPAFSAPDLRPEGTRTVALPGPVDSVVPGGAGGQFLIFHSKPLSKLIIFDVSKAAVVKTIPLPAGDFTFAAGRTKLMVGLREANAIQRWDLTSLEREVTSQGPEGGFQAIACGYNAVGPFFVAGPKKTFALDPGTMRMERVRWNEYDDSPGVIAASADNRLIVGYSFPGWAGVRTMPMDAGVPTAHYTGGYIHYNFMLPFADASLIVDTMERGKFWLPDMSKEIPLEGNPGPPIPAYDPSFFTTFGVIDGKAKVVIHNAGDFKPLVTHLEFDELAAEAPLPAYQRVHFYPDLNLLVTVGGKGEQVVLRTLDVKKELDGTGLDYLLVTNRSPWSVEKGRPYQYPVRVIAKNGAPSVSLESGPPGMTLSAQNLLTWTPPANFAEKDVNVTLLIKDAKGQETLHAFSIRVLDPPAPTK